MSLSPLGSVGSLLSPAPRALPPSGGLAPATQNSPAEVARAAQQFEAILLRQFLAPAVEPMMNGSALGGKDGGAGAGGGVYSYLLTDVLSNAMSKGGGLGLARVLQRQMSPANPLTAAAAANSAGAVSPAALLSSKLP